jgi:hypothetical protein
MNTSRAAQTPPQIPERILGQSRKPAEAPRHEDSPPPAAVADEGFELEAYDMPCTD